MPKSTTKPVVPAPAPPRERATATPPAYSTFKRLSRSKSFSSIADRAVELRKLVAVGDAAKDELKRLAEEELEPELLAGGVGENTTIEYNGVKLRIADEGSGSRIDGAALVRLGVSKKLIEQATVPNKRKHYLSIELPLEVVNQVLVAADLPVKEAKRAKKGAESE